MSSTTEQYQYWLKKYPDLPIDNPAKTYKQLKALNKSPSYVKVLLCAIIWKIKQDDPQSPLIEDYRTYLQLVRGISEKKERDNKSYSGVIPKWDEVIKIRNKLKGKDHLILSLYTYIAPRRLKDMVLLKFVEDEPDDTKFNYYVSNKKVFVFNVYKTAKTFHRQEIKAPVALQRIIEDYVKDNDIKSGDSLLGITKYLQLNYKLKKLIGCSVDNLRHSYINYAYSKYDMPKSAKLENTATKMGHSLTTHLRYRKMP